MYVFKALHSHLMSFALISSGLPLRSAALLRMSCASVSSPAASLEACRRPLDVNLAFGRVRRGGGGGGGGFQCSLGGKDRTALDTLLFKYRSIASAMFRKPVSLYGMARKSAGMLSCFQDMSVLVLPRVWGLSPTRGDDCCQCRLTLSTTVYERPFGEPDAQESCYARCAWRCKHCML